MAHAVQIDLLSEIYEDYREEVSISSIVESEESSTFKKRDKHGKINI
jgi:hypothetical protein